jgi:hypothetical protein
VLGSFGDNAPGLVPRAAHGQTPLRGLRSGSFVPNRTMALAIVQSDLPRY